MWWYGYGWWWWWVAFVILFFLLPLGYGWGYRGWGPWYRRGHSTGTARGGVLPGRARGNLGPETGPGEETDEGWGWLGIFLWFILLIAFIWLIVAWGWGGRWGGYY